MLSVQERAAQIRLLVLDVDGVCTDGGLYYMPDGQVFKRFNVQDGLGIKLALENGLDIAVITGLNQAVVELRMRELGIEEYHAGYHNKLPILQDICKRKKLSLQQVAFLGDDWVDATAMQAVGLPLSVPNARPEIKKLAVWLTKNTGGHGAVRDSIDFLLQATGRFDEAWGKWCDQ